MANESRSVDCIRPSGCACLAAAGTPASTDCRIGWPKLCVQPNASPQATEISRNNLAANGRFMEAAWIRQEFAAVILPQIPRSPSCRLHQCPRDSRHLQILRTLEQLPPLLEGEGWGEGEGDSNLFIGTILIR